MIDVSIRPTKPSTIFKKGSVTWKSHLIDWSNFLGLFISAPSIARNLPDNECVLDALTNLWLSKVILSRSRCEILFGEALQPLEYMKRSSKTCRSFVWWICTSDFSSLLTTLVSVAGCRIATFTTLVKVSRALITTETYSLYFAREDNDFSFVFKVYVLEFQNQNPITSITRDFDKVSPYVRFHNLYTTIVRDSRILNRLE